MATATIYSTAGDGYVYLSGNNWGTVRGTAAGSSNDDTSATMVIYADYGAGPVYNLSRGFLAFDLATVPAGSTVSSVVLNLTPKSITNNDSVSIGIVKGTQASTTALENTDFNKFETTEYCTRVTLASMSADTNKQITLNATAVAYIQSVCGSSAKLCIRTNKDIDNSAPSVDLNRLELYCSEQTGTTKDPYLTITYEPPLNGNILWF